MTVPVTEEGTTPWSPPAAASARWPVELTMKLVLHTSQHQTRRQLADVIVGPTRGEAFASQGNPATPSTQPRFLPNPVPVPPDGTLHLA